MWIQGPPYPDGKYTNIKNFNTVLVHFLKSGQWIEADEGYPGHTVKYQMPWKWRESGGEVVDAGEGEGMTGDVE